MRLETERLSLRDFEESDLDALETVLGNIVAMTYYDHPFSREECTAWIQDNRKRYARDGYGLWGLVEKDSDELVGDCGLTTQVVDGVDRVEVGWHVRMDLWGRGYATEAGRACVELAFNEFALPEVIALVRPENRSSCRVAEKLGMEVSGETLRGEQQWVNRVYLLGRPDLAVPR